MEYYIGLWYTKNSKKNDENVLLVMLGLERNELVQLSKNHKVVSRYMKELDRKIRNTLISKTKNNGIDQEKKT